MAAFGTAWNGIQVICLACASITIIITIMHKNSRRADRFWSKTFWNSPSCWMKMIDGCLIIGRRQSIIRRLKFPIRIQWCHTMCWGRCWWCPPRSQQSIGAMSIWSKRLLRIFLESFNDLVEIIIFFLSWNFPVFLTRWRTIAAIAVKAKFTMWHDCYSRPKRNGRF